MLPLHKRQGRSGDVCGTCRRLRVECRSRNAASAKMIVEADNDLSQRFSSHVSKKSKMFIVPVIDSSRSLTRIAALVGLVAPGSTLS